MMRASMTAALCILVFCSLAAAQSGKPPAKPAAPPPPTPTPKPISGLGTTVTGTITPTGNGGWTITPLITGPGVGMGTISDPGLDIEALRARCRKTIERCRDAIAKDDWVQAKEAFDQALLICVDKALGDELGELASQLEVQGRRELAQAGTAFESGDYVWALKEYGRISRTFMPLPVGKEALALLKQAEADPKAQAGVQEVKALALNTNLERMLAAQTTTATSGPASRPASQPAAIIAPTANRPARIKLLPPEKTLEAVDSLTRIATLFPLSPTGKQAAADLEELKGDKAFQDALAKLRQAAAAKAALGKAQMYRDTGMTVKAVELYQEVIANFPGTAEAQKAKDALAQQASWATSR